MAEKYEDWREEFLLHNSVWVAKLEDGSEMWMDDGRPDCTSQSSLDRLRASSRNIVQFGFRFRRRTIWPFPPNAYGYYFARAMSVVPNSTPWQSFRVGVLEQPVSPGRWKCRLESWKVPELEFEWIDHIEIAICDRRVVLGKATDRQIEVSI